MNGVKLYRLPIERFDALPEFSRLNRRFDDNDTETRRRNLEEGSEICIVADYDGMLIGEVNIMLKNDNIKAAVLPNKRAYLYGFFIRDELRGYGIGTELMKEAISVCNLRGYIEQTVAAEKGCPAVKLYERLGFRLFLRDLLYKETTFDLYLRVGDLG